MKKTLKWLLTPTETEMDDKTYIDFQTHANTYKDFKMDANNYQDFEMDAYTHKDLEINMYKILLLIALSSFEDSKLAL